MPACPGTSTGWLFFSHALIFNKNPHLWMTLTMTVQLITSDKNTIILWSYINIWVRNIVYGCYINITNSGGCMIKFFTNRELSDRLGINLAKWKRWSREFLPPDPLGGMQSGYARQYTSNQAFTVFFGGHLVADLKFSIPEARQIIQDLNDWMSEKGFYYDLRGRSSSDESIDTLIKKHIIFIWREKGSDKGFNFVYTIRGVISNETVQYKGFEMMKKLYVETFLNKKSEKPSEMNMNVVKTLYITGILTDFVDAMGLDRTRYVVLS